MQAKTLPLVKKIVSESIGDLFLIATLTNR